MLGSFAKTLTPALALGYLIVPPALRDRVADLGGSFTAGPTDEGGWRAMAEFPIVPE